MDWDTYGWVQSSNYRSNILTSLGEKPKLPRQIAEEYEYYLSHVSNYLTELDEKGLVKCLTPERNKGRVYALTDKGREIYEEMTK